MYAQFIIMFSINADQPAHGSVEVCQAYKTECEEQTRL
jgi:hypothetical protein